MPYRAYSYRLKREIALLNEDEWKPISVLLRKRMKSIQQYRKETGASIAEAVANAPSGKQALAAYYELTGIKLEHPDQLYAVVMSEYGRLCSKCKRPFRTPKACFCAECGYKLEEGKIAGPLLSA